MTSKTRLLQDRAMRDAARQLVDDDLATLRGDVARQGIGSRLLQSGTDGAREAAGVAQDYVDENPGAVATGVGLAVAGLAAWLLRDQLAGLVHGLFAGHEPEPEAPEGPSPDSTANRAGDRT